jgi:hypothetical protein
VLGCGEMGGTPRAHRRLASKGAQKARTLGGAHRGGCGVSAQKAKHRRCFGAVSATRDSFTPASGPPWTATTSEPN